MVDSSSIGATNLGDEVRASLHGYWGFDAYQGPQFRLIHARARNWELAGGDETALIVGRLDTVHVKAGSINCIDTIMLKDLAGKEVKVDWKSLKADEIQMKLPLQDARPGGLTLLIAPYGIAEPQAVPLQIFAAAGRFDGFSIHAGDLQGTLKGSRLDEVANLTLNNVIFVPGTLASHAGSDELTMIAQDGRAASNLKPSDPAPAKVALQDGRTIAVAAAVEPARPRVVLINRDVQASAMDCESNIKLADADELPQAASLAFSIKAQSPAAFSRDSSVDVAAGDVAFGQP